MPDQHTGRSSEGRHHSPPVTLSSASHPEGADVLLCAQAHRAASAHLAAPGSALQRHPSIQLFANETLHADIQRFAVRHAWKANWGLSGIQLLQSCARPSTYLAALAIITWSSGKNVPSSCSFVPHCSRNTIHMIGQHPFHSKAEAGRSGTTQRELLHSEIKACRACITIVNIHSVARCCQGDWCRQSLRCFWAQHAQHKEGSAHHKAPCVQELAPPGDLVNP